MDNFILNHRIYFLDNQLFDFRINYLVNCLDNELVNCRDYNLVNCLDNELVDGNTYNLVDWMDNHLVDCLDNFKRNIESNVTIYKSSYKHNVFHSLDNLVEYERTGS